MIHLEITHKNSSVLPIMDQIWDMYPLFFPFNGMTFELNNLRKASCISHFWNDFIQEYSKRLLLKYFPYLVSTHPQYFTGYKMIYIPSLLDIKILERGTIYLSMNTQNQLQYMVVSYWHFGDREAIVRTQALKIMHLSQPFNPQKILNTLASLILKEIANNKDCCTNTLKLLITECTKYDKEIFFRISIESLLAALNGEFKKIATQIDDDKKHELYAYFFANGHTAELNVKPDDYQKILKKALEYATKNGYVSVAEKLLTLVNVDMFLKHEDPVLLSAAKNGYDSIVLAILQKKKGKEEISPYNNHLAAQYAAESGHLLVTHAFLHQGNKGLELNDAAIYNQFLVVQYLLNETRYGLFSSSDKGKALINSALNGRYIATELLLKDNRHEPISAFDKLRDRHIIYPFFLKGHQKIHSSLSPCCSQIFNRYFYFFVNRLAS